MTIDVVRAATAKWITETLKAAGLTTLTEDLVLQMNQANFQQLIEACSTAPDTPIYKALLSVREAVASIAPVAEMSPELTAHGKRLWEWNRDLGVHRAGTATPQHQLNAAREAYIQDRSLAAAGNSDAYERLERSADAYIQAVKLNDPEEKITPAVAAQVRSEIANLSTAPRGG